MLTSMPGRSNGRSRTASSDSKPVAGTKLRGSTVSRSDLRTTEPALKNWLTVIITRRFRPSRASASSTKPRDRPAKLTRRWSAAQYASSVSAPGAASGWSRRITPTYSHS